MKPLAIDLFCGLGGWAEGFLAEDYDVIGFDIEVRPYPAQLVIQDVLTLHGSQFKSAAVIVASPPCTEYSYMAMPWSRAKQIAGALREEVPFPEGYKGSRTVTDLNRLFDACFRIQREACEAAGRYIPMVVENVKGAQPWVGKAKANYGSFYFWGDIDMVGNRVVCGKLGIGCGLGRSKRVMKRNPDGTEHGAGSWFKVADSVQRGAHAVKVPGFRFDGSGGSFQSASVSLTKADHRLIDGCKGLDGKSWIRDPSKDPRPSHGNSQARKAASAQIAKIPFPLANHIARCYKPDGL